MNGLLVNFLRLARPSVLLLHGGSPQLLFLFVLVLLVHFYDGLLETLHDAPDHFDSRFLDRGLTIIDFLLIRLLSDDNAPAQDGVMHESFEDS